MAPSPRGLAPRATRLLLPLLLGVLAFVVRALPRQQIFIGDDVHPLGHDAYYHLRRIAYSVVRFPEVLTFDRYINHPEGARPIWSPLFDWLVAAFCLPFFRAGELESIERVAMWVPPLLGAATVVSLYALVRRHFDGATAWLAALLLAVLPAHFWYSQVGFLDHHAAVALVSLWLLAAAMGWLDVECRACDESRRWRWAALGGASAALALLTWPGCLLHVGLVELGLLAWLFTRARLEDAEGFAGRFAAANLLVALALLPFAGEWPQWGGWSPLVLSRFQPWLFGAFGLVAVGAAGIWRLPAAGGSRGRRAVSASLLGLVLLAVSAALVPALRSGVADAVAWFARAESFQASVAESQPLLWRAGRLDFSAAWARLTGLALLFPLAWLAAVRACRGNSRAAALWLWLGWSAALCAATLVQRRFFNSFAPALAWVSAWGLYRAWLLAGRRWPAPGPRRCARAGLVVVALALLSPALDSYRSHLHNELRSADDLQRFESWLLPRRNLIEMARWLGRRTPETQGWVDGTQVPEYGVMAPWDVGHVIEYQARRPTVTNEFGDDIGARNFALARQYYQSREAAGSEILERLGARYVVAQPRPGFLGEAPVEGGLFEALFFFDGTEPEPPAPDAPPALARHRLVYESPTYGRDGKPVPSLYKVFEHVAGARITGRAPPGARLRAELPLRTNRGRELVYRVHFAADAGGRYAVRVPYATRGAPPAVRPGPAYTLSCAGGAARAVVDERDVRSGAELAGPDLCL